MNKPCGRSSQVGEGALLCRPLGALGRSASWQFSHGRRNSGLLVGWSLACMGKRQAPGRRHASKPGRMRSLGRSRDARLVLAGAGGRSGWETAIREWAALCAKAREARQIAHAWLPPRRKMPMVGGAVARIWFTKPGAELQRPWRRGIWKGFDVAGGWWHVLCWGDGDLFACIREAGLAGHPASMTR